MTGSNNRDVVMTVTGPVDPVELGVTLTHEHIFLDAAGLPSSQASADKPPTERQRRLAGKPLTMEILGAARRDMSIFPELLTMDDPDIARDELGEFKHLGGRTIVDVTPKGLYGKTASWRLEVLAQLSRELDLNVVVSCAYVARPTPRELADASVEAIADQFVREITDGIAGSGIRPGVIGEIVMSQPIHYQEWKVLDAACLAQKQTGLPLLVHPHFGSQSRIAPEIAKHVLRLDVNPQKVNMCHMDGYMNIQYQRRVADMGVYVSFDTFGCELYYDNVGFNHNCHDSHREEFLMELLDLGYVDQLLISQDVATKLQLVRFGGFGYAHIQQNILPSLRHRGLDEGTIERLLIDNPRRFLAIDSSAPTYQGRSLDDAVASRVTRTRC